jgi:hypothetical protein
MPATGLTVPAPRTSAVRTPTVWTAVIPVIAGATGPSIPVWTAVIAAPSRLTTGSWPPARAMILLPARTLRLLLRSLRTRRLTLLRRPALRPALPAAAAMLSFMLATTRMLAATVLILRQGRHRCR